MSSDGSGANPDLLSPWYLLLGATGWFHLFLNGAQLEPGYRYLAVKPIIHFTVASRVHLRAACFAVSVSYCTVALVKKKRKKKR